MDISSISKTVEKQDGWPSVGFDVAHFICNLPQKWCTTLKKFDYEMGWISRTLKAVFQVVKKCNLDLWSHLGYCRTLAEERERDRSARVITNSCHSSYGNLDISHCVTMQLELFFLAYTAQFLNWKCIGRNQSAAATYKCICWQRQTDILSKFNGLGAAQWFWVSLRYLRQIDLNFQSSIDKWMIHTFPKIMIEHFCSKWCERKMDGKL